MSKETTRDSGTRIVTVQTPNGEQKKTNAAGTALVTATTPRTPNKSAPVPSPTSYGPTKRS
jgi:hypothetical protein